MLYVGTTAPDRLRPYFTEVRPVTAGGSDVSVWLLTGRREPWTTLSPHLRTLTLDDG